MTKKKFLKKKLKNKDAVHFEGKYYCDCRIRKYRDYLSK